MAHSIDDTLAKLQDAMEVHRRALTRGPSLRSSAELALPDDRRALLVLQVLSGVERRAGIEVSQASAEKLLRLLDQKGKFDLAAWVSRLESLPASDPEWLSLIESLTVHETYIMRDPSQLELFAAQLPSLIAAADAAKTYRLRMWSVGCATGEEAYSIAALAFDALIAAGKASISEQGISLLPPWRIEVIGSDISRPTIIKAQTGIYDTGPLSSVREESPVISRHFPFVPGTAKSNSTSRGASADLKSVTRFQHFNIVADQAPGRPFDTVFCRNVLIYFSDRARRRAQDMLLRAVRENGYLVLGSTDTVFDTAAFEMIWAPGAVIYRRRPANA
jgi:chemotaxis protein methyltransferase CheR